MPEHEFEIYLSLLSRLLRLSPEQKAAISDELRDHLEQRLTALLQSGKSRDEAIRLVEEFGDVTGLALDLTRVSRTPLKKVVVGTTIAASITAALVVGWITFFIPEHRIVAPTPAEAQQEQPAEAANSQKAAEPQQRPEVATKSSAFLADTTLFPAFLTEPTEVEFNETPLSEAGIYLESLHNVPVMLHRTALTDAGIELDHPVTLRLKGLSLEEVLNHFTRQLGLSWEVDAGIVRITTPDSATMAAHMRTRHFDLRRLTRRGHKLDTLLNVIRLAGSDWSYDGSGEATTALIGESVVVRQTFQNQRRIARALAAIEEQRPLAVLGVCTERDRLLAAVNEPSEVEFVETPLAEALEFLAERHQVQILIDRQALVDEGVEIDYPVTLTLKDRPLGKLLELLLSEMGLTYQIRDGVIRVTTVANAENDMVWTVYNIHDLVPSRLLLMQLSDAILETTNGLWEEIDGEGGAFIVTDVDECLLVKQTDQVQFAIQSLLVELQRSGADHAVEAVKPAPQPRLVTKSYRMPTDVATDLRVTLASLVSPESWSKTAADSPSIFVVASVPQRDQVDGLVSGGTNEVQVLNSPKETPKADAKTEAPAGVKSIVVRPRSILVIRQSPQVHHEIQTFLQKLGMQVEVGDLETGGIGRPRLMGGFGGGGFGGGGFGGGGFGGDGFN